MNLGLASGDVEAACLGQIDMAETHSNGYVYDKLLKKKISLPIFQSALVRVVL